MRTRLFLVVTLAALLGAGAAYAGGGGRAAARAAGIIYTLTGKLTATPVGGDVSVDVKGGNRPALRAMVGQSPTQTFSYGDSTEFLRWSNGTPSVVEPGDLAAGDYVVVRIRARVGSSLADIEGIDALAVADHGAELNPPSQPLYLFRGKLTAVGSSSITVAVRGGNRRALRLLIGNSGDQTFTVGGSTIFVLWHGKVPTAIGLSDLKVGDAVGVRIRAAAGSSLDQVEATPAVHVAEHEPVGKS